MAIRSPNIQDGRKLDPMPAQPNKGLMKDRFLPQKISLAAIAGALSGVKPLDLKAKFTQNSLNSTLQELFHDVATTRLEIFAQHELGAKIG